MRILLDTHALLWWLTDDPRLSLPARESIAEENNQVLVSAVTGWEVSTKCRLGKLPEADGVIGRLPEIIQRAGMKILPLSLAHGLRAGYYANKHRDPFDRMLAAQAEVEGLHLVSRDPVFADFPVKLVW